MASQGTVYAFIPSPYTWDSTLAKKIALNELRVGHNSDDGASAAAFDTCRRHRTIGESINILNLVAEVLSSDMGQCLPCLISSLNVVTCIFKVIFYPFCGMRRVGGVNKSVHTSTPSSHP